MSLNYSLPGEMTNGELADIAPDIHASLFGICVSTMDTGVPVINGKWLDRMMEAIDHGEGIFSSLTEDEQRDWVIKIYSILRGMTTNASRKNEKQWAETLKAN